MATPRTPATRVLRMAVVVDDGVSEELHQTKPGSVSVGTSYAADVLLFDPTAPVRHPLFDYRDGAYFLDLPPNARGKISRWLDFSTEPGKTASHAGTAQAHSIAGARDVTDDACGCYCAPHRCPRRPQELVSLY